MIKPIKPITFIATGDVPKARMLRKAGLNQMNILMRQRALGLKDEERRVSPWNGIEITCIAGLRRNEVIINVAKPPKKGGEPLLVIKEKKECICLPHFSLGIIEKVIPTAITGETIDELNVRFWYDVSICAEDRYVLFEGAMDANFGRYYVGQYVLVTVSKEPDDCNRKCLLDFPRFDALTISPIHLSGAMMKWSLVLSEEETSNAT